MKKSRRMFSLAMLVCLSEFQPESENVSEPHVRWHS